MGLISNRVLSTKLQPGDHIYCYRMAHIYSHHGIYVEDDTVIHFKPANKELPNWKPKPKCAFCGYNPNYKQRGGVVKTCLKCFLDGHSLFRFEYKVSKLEFLVQAAGACSTGTPDEPSKVIKRATEMLETQGFGKYSFLDNNCETFAVYCKTGKRESTQALSLIASVEIALSNLNDKSICIKNVAQAGFKALGPERRMVALRKDLSVHHASA